MVRRRAQQARVVARPGVTDEDGWLINMLDTRAITGLGHESWTQRVAKWTCRHASDYGARCRMLCMELPHTGQTALSARPETAWGRKGFELLQLRT
jgi:hypothetical protein